MNNLPIKVSFRKLTTNEKLLNSYLVNQPMSCMLKYIRIFNICIYIHHLLVYIYISDLYINIAVLDSS